MCIRARNPSIRSGDEPEVRRWLKSPDDRSLVEMDGILYACLLYTSDAADERSSVDLGGRRIIKKKNKTRNPQQRAVHNYQ